MRKILKKNFRKGERGNVLFLILIAVALFAALSYAVTSSSRSGGGDAGSESALVKTAAVTQYPASVRTTLIRMIVSKNISASQMAFNKPPYTNLDDDAGDVDAGVFHPSGGGAIYSPANADIMVDGQPGEWFFNGTLGIEDIGIDANSDIIAFLPGVKQAICEKINSELGLVAPPTVDADLDGIYTVDMADSDGDATTAIPATGYASTAADMIAVATTNTLAGVPYGCFINGGTPAEYVYYHVLVER